MQDDKDDLTGMRKNNGIPKFVEEEGSDSARGYCSFIGENDCVLSYWSGTTIPRRQNFLVTPLYQTHYGRHFRENKM